MPRLRSGGNAPTPARTDATRRPVLREKTNITGTPAAVETSMLALKNFKRRPRQGSMLEMVRKRRSSVQQSLVSAQPQDDDDVEGTSVFDLGSASEGEDDFAPEAEGTPIQTSKTRKSTSTRKSASARKSVAPTPAPAAKKSKRKSDDLESPHSALDALRKKHRKSEVSHVEDKPLPSIDDDHQPAEHAMSEHEASPVPEPVTSDVQVLNSSPESTPPTEPSSTHKASNVEEANFTVPSTEEQARADATHENAQEDQEDQEAADDDLDTPNATMAEPASSSPIGSPIPETQSTDIYADPLTQDSPPPSPEPARTRGKGAQKKPTALSTATLRALLPRRTQRATQRPRRTEYDISSDEEEEGTGFDTTHLDEDEDELGGRMRRQNRNAAPAKGKKAAAAAAAAKSTKTKSNPKQQKPPASTRNKSKAPSQPATTGKGKGKGKTTRTYGRTSAVTASDKENENEASSEGEEGEANTSLSMREVAHSKELEEARRKFAEVDDWDLTFESMSNEDHRSSSQGWR